MAAVKTISMSFPYPLGKILPAGTTASLPLTTNVTPVKEDGVTAETRFAEIVIIAAFANGGVIYICNNALAPDTTNYTNIICELAAGQSFPREGEWSNNKDIDKLFVGASDGTSFAYGYISQF